MSRSSNWYYAKDDQQQGPVSEADLKRRLASGLLGAETLVWRDGMEKWAAASSVGELAPASAVAGFPPPAAASATSPAPAAPAPPTADGDNDAVTAAVPEAVSPYAPPSAEPPDLATPVITSGSQVRPWIRYWARTFDILSFAFLLGVVLAFALPAALEINDTLFGIVLLVAMAFVEAACLALFATTPGKALLRIRVCNHDGSRLSYAGALGRSLRVLVRGLGLGIPIVALVTHIMGYTTLTRDGITSWDSAGNHLVAHREIPVWRGILVVLVFFGAASFFGYLATLGEGF